MRNTTRKRGYFAALIAVAAVAGGLIAARTFGAGGADAQAHASAEMVSGRRALCAIVIPDSPGEVETHAAEELRLFIGKISGAEMDIIAEKDAGGRCGIYVGDTRLGKQIVPDDEIAPLGSDGFVLRERGSNVAVRGGHRGTLYGVYAILEDHLGIHWLAPDTTIIPKRDTIDLAGLEDTQKPAMEYREVYFHDAFDGDWAARNRLNGGTHRVDGPRGGRTNYLGFVHTFNALLPKEKYFAEHPEYYALVSGKRVDNTQPCLTNPDVLKIVTDRVLELAASTNGAPTIISVSQNDNMMPCECERCRASDREEGSPSGTLIKFVNQVADAVAEKYPNVLIDTLAYQYTENVPRHAKPRPNVIVRLCHMAPSCDTHSLEHCYLNANYVHNLKAWSSISNRLYVWHYVTDFAAYLLPLPDLNAIKRDMPFYVKHHVRGLFAQGDGESPGAESAEIKSWLIAKLLWNDKADFESLYKEFIDGYYGPAAPDMLEYYNLQRKHALSKSVHAHLYAPPDGGHLSPELLGKMNASLVKAEAAAASDPLAAEHVRRARLWMTFTQLAAPRLFTPENGFPKMSPNQQLTMLESFKKEIARANITRLREGKPLDEYYKKLRLNIYGWKE